MRQSWMPGSISEQNRFLSGLSGRYLSGSNDDLQWMQRRNPTDPIEDKGILEKIDRLVSEKSVPSTLVSVVSRMESMNVQG